MSHYSVHSTRQFLSDDTSTVGDTAAHHSDLPAPHGTASHSRTTLPAVAHPLPATHPPIFWLGGRQRQYPPPILLRTFGYSRPILVAPVRSASSRFHSAIRRHRFASVRQADSWLTRLQQCVFSVYVTAFG